MAFVGDIWIIPDAIIGVREIDDILTIPVGAVMRRPPGTTILTLPGGRRIGAPTPGIHVGTPFMASVGDIWIISDANYGVPTAVSPADLLQHVFPPYDLQGGNTGKVFDCTE